MTTAAGRLRAQQSVDARFRHLVASGRAAWPMPGGGRTRERFEGLAEIAAEDLSLARLVEGHADAVAISAEAGRMDTRRAPWPCGRRMGRGCVWRRTTCRAAGSSGASNDSAADRASSIAPS